MSCRTKKSISTRLSGGLCPLLVHLCSYTQCKWCIYLSKYKMHKNFYFWGKRILFIPSLITDKKYYKTILKIMLKSENLTWQNDKSAAVDAGKQKGSWELIWRFHSPSVIFSSWTRVFFLTTWVAVLDLFFFFSQEVKVHWILGWWFLFKKRRSTPRTSLCTSAWRTPRMKEKRSRTHTYILGKLGSISEKWSPHVLWGI